MIFGDKDEYAIEVYHEPLDNNSFYMTGRMCLHFYGEPFGDINYAGYVGSFCVTYRCLLEKINDLESIKYNFDLETDVNIFDFLNVKLYMADDETTYEQIVIDDKKYRKYDFLTNGGEMFDGTISFIYLDNNEKIHILYQIHYKNDEIICIQLDKETFINVTKEFIKWYESTSNINITK